MFKLNEAPQIVIDALSKRDSDRSCGYFWSWACCIPTLGFSICCNDSDNDDYTGCCFPQPVSIKTENGLQGLTIALNEIKQAKNLEVHDLKDGKTENDLITWQVEQTLKTLKEFIDNKCIGKGYNSALRRAFHTIKTKAESANTIAQLIPNYNENSPLNDTSKTYNTYTTCNIGS